MLIVQLIEVCVCHITFLIIIRLQITFNIIKTTIMHTFFSIKLLLISYYFNFLFYYFYKWDYKRSPLQRIPLEGNY
jgi:hypothetical protein